MSGRRHARHWLNTLKRIICIGIRYCIHCKYSSTSVVVRNCILFTAKFLLAKGAKYTI